MLRSDNTIAFDVLILIRSVIQIHDLKRYIASAFNDYMDIYMYVNTLKASGDIAFRDITTVSISPSFGSSTTTTTTNGSSVNSATKETRDTSYLIAAILSVVVTVVAGMGLVACFLQYQRQQQHLELKRFRRNETFLTSITPEDGFASEIEIGACTDMSSLGDPSLISQYYGGGGGGGLAFMNAAPTVPNGDYVVKLWTRRRMRPSWMQ